MKIDEFASFLNLDDHDTAETLRRLKETSTAELTASRDLGGGWAEW